MSRAIASWPDHPIRPGAAADGCDCKWDSQARSNEHSNRCWDVSPETSLEVVPRPPITTLKVDRFARFWPDGQNHLLFATWVGRRAPTANCE